jgi:hypothetical protein
MKLSEIWERAARELKQGGGMGFNPEDETHCALGAIVHYRFGHDNCLGNNWLTLCETQSDVMKFARLFRGEKGEITLERIYRRNDDDQKRWSFKRFAAKAREFEDSKTPAVDLFQIRLTAFPIIDERLVIEVLAK